MPEGERTYSKTIHLLSTYVHNDPLEPSVLRILIDPQVPTSSRVLLTFSFSLFL